jgi:hypothetical protein
VQKHFTGTTFCTLARESSLPITPQTNFNKCNRKTDETTLEYTAATVRDTAQISINDAATDVRFVWAEFDGDDGFNDFHIDVTGKCGTQRFSFGPCAVHGLRKVSRFFRDKSQESVGLGFRHPDNRYCDIFRVDGDYRLVVGFEGSGLSEQHHVQTPSIHLGDDFLVEY